jgi:hypothetical protein
MRSSTFPIMALVFTRTKRGFLERIWLSWCELRPFCTETGPTSVGALYRAVWLIGTAVAFFVRA